MPAKSSEKSSCEIKSSEKTASFEKLSTAPFDTRFPNQNQTRLVVFFSNFLCDSSFSLLNSWQLHSRSQRVIYDY